MSINYPLHIVSKKYFLLRYCRVEKRLIETPSNQPICITKYKSASASFNYVIIAPATGVKQAFYAHFAEFLSEQGYTVYTFDYQGIGESKTVPLGKFDTTALNWAQNDLESVIQYVLREKPDSKLTIIGHSIGGQLIGLAPSSKLASKVLLIAAQSGYWKFWDGMSKYKMLGTWSILFPILTKIFGYFPGKKFSRMEDLPKGVALEWSKWCLSPNYLFDHVEKENLFHEQITCPLYSYSVEDDDYAPKAAVDWMTSKYHNAQVNRKHWKLGDLGVKKVGHFGFFSKKNAEVIWSRILRDTNA